MRTWVQRTQVKQWQAARMQSGQLAGGAGSRAYVVVALVSEPTLHCTLLTVAPGRQQFSRWRAACIQQCQQLVIKTVC